MHSFLTLFALSVIASIFIFPSSSVANEHRDIDEAKEIKELYASMYRYMIAKDTENLSFLLDNSFVLVHMTGMKQTKQEYLKAIKTGTLNYFSEELDNIDVKISGDRAAVIGQSRVNAAVFGGGRHTWRLELDIDFIRKDGRWLMIEARASTY